MNCQEVKAKDVKCRGWAEIIKETDTMENKKPHNHPTRIEMTSINLYKGTIYDASECLTSLTLHQIFMKMTTHHKLGHLVTYKNCEPGMRKRREKMYPRLPQNIEEIGDLMKEAPDELSSIYQGVLRLEGNNSLLN